jgi:hypothetical protein
VEFVLLLFTFYPTTETELYYSKIRLLVLYSVTLYADLTKAFFAFGMSCGFQDARVNVILFGPTRKYGLPCSDLREIYNCTTA